MRTVRCFHGPTRHQRLFGNAIIGNRTRKPFERAKRHRRPNSTFQPRRLVGRCAVVIQPVVQRHRDTAPNVKTDLNRHRRPPGMRINCFKIPMDLNTAVQTIERIGKRGHDGIADGLDDRPIFPVPLSPIRQNAVEPNDRPGGRGSFRTTPSPLQILKHDCEVVDIDIVAPPQQLSSKTSQNACNVVDLSAVNASRRQANSSTMKVNRQFSDRRG